LKAFIHAHPAWLQPIAMDETDPEPKEPRELGVMEQGHAVCNQGRT
jgi:hypothetical protein